MLEAAIWGAIAGASLLIGAVIALVAHPSPRTVGFVMAFGAGTLIAAVSFDLIGDSLALEDSEFVAVAMLLGALMFFVGDTLVSSAGGHKRKSLSAGDGEAEGEQDESGVAIVFGTVLDGVPESFVMGLALIEGGDEALGLIMAVFISNLPKAIGATSSLARSGWTKVRIIAMWAGIAAITAISSMLGYAFFDAAAGQTGARIEGFAAGAILAMLATTMIPESHRLAGRLVGIVMTLASRWAYGSRQRRRQPLARRGLQAGHFFTAS